MKTINSPPPPPLSPYGVFSGSLFQYSSSPSLIAFESLPPPPTPLKTDDIDIACSSKKNKCILIGGLSDGPIPTPYTKLLETECHNLGWALVQPVLSSSYLGFGHGSLARDSAEIGQLLAYLVTHHDAEQFALVGHSTGCQNSIHFLKYGQQELVEKVKVVALQAPVSDRETDDDHSEFILHAQSLVGQQRGDEMMPRSAFWAPITASRYLSLLDVDGEDDFFSSDLTDDQLCERLGHVGRKKDLDLIAVYSGKDEYVPSFVDKEVLLRRMVKAMNNGVECCDVGGDNGSKEGNASGLMLENANHNLSESEGDGASYATKEMSSIFSPAMKFTTWRKLWLALATAEQELGLEITDEQLQQMKDQLYNVDFTKANEYESKFRHDVMGHVHAFGDVAPQAMPIIHLGATSCYVGDNTDIIQLKEALKLVQRKLVQTLAILKTFAEKYADLPTLGFTHYQPAQLTTVGKRCTLWMQDLLLDYERVTYELENLPMRGVKGTTGTQATFLELFNGDHEKVKQLNSKVCKAMGFEKVIAVSGQTYTRKIDYHILSLLSGIAQSAYKMCGDIRLLANLKEVEEPFAKNQIGSSAMAYKRNPMRSERCCSLSRYIMSLPPSAANTHANQWFERTLDDSAIRRIILPEGFLAVDVVLNLLMNIADGMVVWPNVVHKHVMEELPFMATEVILMECVKAGGDRQELHEAIRVHSMDAGKVVKGEGKPNDLLERIAKDPLFKAVHSKLDTLVDPKLFIGRAKEQTEEFLAEEIDPVLQKEEGLLGKEVVDGVNV